MRQKTDEADEQLKFIDPASPSFFSMLPCCVHNENTVSLRHCYAGFILSRLFPIHLDAFFHHYHLLSGTFSSYLNRKTISLPNKAVAHPNINLWEKMLVLIKWTDLFRNYFYQCEAINGDSHSALQLLCHNTRFHLL